MTTTLAFKDYVATGSILADSTKLTLTSNPGFQVGDQVIVEIGSEAGAGRRGTVGVGGTWPELSYASAAERESTEPPAINTYAYDRDTKLVWQWLGTAWDGSVTQWLYYTAQAIPRSLCATIVSIKNDVTLTLDRAAVVAAANANVYYDNAKRFWDEVGNEASGFVPADNTLVIPEGQFAFSSPMKIREHHGWIVTGSGDTSQIFSPKGVWGASVLVQNSDDVVLENFSLQSNARNEGFGLAWNTLNADVVVDETHLPQGTSFPVGAQVVSCSGGVIRNISAVDCFQAAISTSYSENIDISNCRVHVTDPHRGYVQWQYEIADSNYISVSDCSLECATLDCGYEFFRSSDCKFERVSSVNGVFSFNSAGRFTLADSDIVIRANSQFDSTFSHLAKIVAITSIIQPPPESVLEGGTISNLNITQEGSINDNGDILYGIGVDKDNPNIIIRGSYPTNPEAGGLIAYPDYSGSGWAGSQIVADEADITVEGIRVTGATAYQIICHAPSTVSNCVVDTLSNDAVANGNVTNAEWEALGPPIQPSSVRIDIAASEGVIVTINGQPISTGPLRRRV